MCCLISFSLLVCLYLWVWRYAGTCFTFVVCLCGCLVFVCGLLGCCCCCASGLFICAFWFVLGWCVCLGLFGFMLCLFALLFGAC